MPFDTGELHYGPNQLFYGREWLHDGMSRFVDALLISRFRDAAHEAGAPRVALDIGCCTGERASTLSKLGVFDRIIATDITDHAYRIRRRNELDVLHADLGEKIAPIEFFQCSAVDLNANRFSEMSVDYVNFRNVAHFLSPPDFCHVLRTIRTIAAPNAVVAVSFDGVKKDEFADYIDLSEDKTLSAAFYDNQDRKTRHVAPYGKYHEVEVRRFMQSIGFNLINDAIPGESRDFRPVECYIIATVPAPPAALASRQMRKNGGMPFLL